MKLLSLISAFASKHHQKLLWLIIGLAVMFFLMRSCNGYKADQYNALKQQAEMLQKQVEQKEQQAKVRRMNDSVALLTANLAVVKAKADVIAVNKKLTQSAARINQLASNLDYYRSLTVDSSFVKVHPKYIENCDSLQIAAVIQQGEINEARREILETVDLMNYEVVLRDSIIENERNHNAVLLADFNRQSALLKNALNNLKPHGQFLVGVGVMGNEQQLLGGGSLKFAYLSKGGKMYMYSPHTIKLPGMNGPQVVHEVSVLLSLFK
jgi:hypothetical protein